MQRTNKWLGCHRVERRRFSKLSRGRIGLLIVDCELTTCMLLHAAASCLALRACFYQRREAQRRGVERAYPLRA